MSPPICVHCGSRLVPSTVSWQRGEKCPCLSAFGCGEGGIGLCEPTDMQLIFRLNNFFLRKNLPKEKYRQAKKKYHRFWGLGSFQPPIHSLGIPKNPLLHTTVDLKAQLDYLSPVWWFTAKSRAFLAAGLSTRFNHEKARGGSQSETCQFYQMPSLSGWRSEPFPKPNPYETV